jgi:hypothetical protein
MDQRDPKDQRCGSCYWWGLHNDDVEQKPCICPVPEWVSRDLERDRKSTRMMFAHEGSTCFHWNDKRRIHWKDK